jgi:hypothetical protein
VFEAGLIGMGGEQHAKFFAAQRHDERVGWPRLPVKGRLHKSRTGFCFTGGLPCPSLG